MSDADLARAYKARALQLHPDRGGSTEAFQALQAAYEEVLKQRGGEGGKGAAGKPKDSPEKKRNTAAAAKSEPKKDASSGEKEKVVEEEMKVTELPITLQEKLSAWPEASKLDTEEKINKMFKLLEDVVRILMIQV